MHRRCLTVFSFAALFASAVAGQQPLPPDTARHADSITFRLEPIEVLVSILGSGGPAAGSGVPARALSVARAELAAWRPRLLGDALVRRPAATLYDDLGSPFKQTVVLRGFAASPVVGLPQGVSVLVDGIPMNEPGAGEVSFDLLPLEHAERLEVLSGTASLLGPNSLGGAVNLVTRRGGASAAALEVEVGSSGARGVLASAGGGAGGFDYFVGGGHERERGWRDDMGGERTHFLASLARLHADRGLRLLLFGARSHAETAGSLPLSVYRIRPDSNLTAGDFELLRQLNAGLSGYTTLGDGIMSLRAYARVGDAERFNVNQEADPDIRGFTASRTVGMDSDWRVEAPAAGGTLDLRVGAGGLLNRTAIELHAERIDPHQTTDVASTIGRADAYGVATLLVGPAVLTAGARWDVIRIPFRNRLRPERDTTSTITHLSPRVGASVRALTGTTIYAAAGRSFRPPALIEIACADPEEPCPLPFALGDDPPIDPVRVTTWETGLAWARGLLAVDLSAYRSEVYDDIFLFPYEEEDEPEGSTIDGYFGNVPHTRREGVEATARAQLGGGHTAFVSYTYTRATFRSAGVEIFSIREAAGGENEVRKGSRFPLVPDHTLSAGGDLTLAHGASFGVLLHRVGRRYLRGDEANVEPPLPAYATVDLRLSLAAHGWEAEGLLRNAADARYAAFGTFNLNQGAGGALERFLTPGRPRSIEIVVRRTF